MKRKKGKKERNPRYCSKLNILEKYRRGDPWLYTFNMTLLCSCCQYITSTTTAMYEYLGNILVEYR